MNFTIFAPVFVLCIVGIFVLDFLISMLFSRKCRIKKSTGGLFSLERRNFIFPLWTYISGSTTRIYDEVKVMKKNLELHGTTEEIIDEKSI